MSDSPLIDEHCIPCSLDEFVEAIERSNKYHAMKLRNGIATKEKFIEYLHDSAFNVNCYYDSATRTYLYEIEPVENYELQRMIEEKLRIKER